MITENSVSSDSFINSQGILGFFLKLLSFFMQKINHFSLLIKLQFCGVWIFKIKGLFLAISYGYSKLTPLFEYIDFNMAMLALFVANILFLRDFNLFNSISLVDQCNNIP
jgi:hypothetical protein